MKQLLAEAEQAGNQTGNQTSEQKGKKRMDNDSQPLENGSGKLLPASQRAEVQQSPPADKDSTERETPVEEIVADFAPPDDGELARITGSNLTPIESLQAARELLRPLDSSASTGKIDSLAKAEVDCLKPLVDHDIAPARAKRTSADRELPLVSTFDAQNSLFLDSLKKVSKKTNPSSSSVTSQSIPMIDGTALKLPEKSPPEGKAQSGAWMKDSGLSNQYRNQNKRFSFKDQLYRGPSRARGGDTAQLPLPSEEEGAEEMKKGPRVVPFTGRRTSEGPIARWSRDADFSKGRSAWAGELGVIRQPLIERPTYTSARNLRRLMCTNIFNVRELYSLRGIACLLVFVAQAQLFVGHNQAVMPLAMIATQLFFVMTGFFVARALVVNECGSIETDVFSFYSRRILRIIPAYYVALIVLLAWGHLPFAESFFACLFNYKLYALNQLSVLSQYWTICVQVQFYLLFPLALLATPKRMRLSMLLGLTVLSLLATYTSAKLHPVSAEFLLLPVCGQFMMVGALAGYIDSATELFLWMNATKCFLLGVALQIGLQIYELGSHDKLNIWSQNLWFDHATISAISFVLIVVGLWRTTNSILHTVFRNETLVYLGKISYGIYLLTPIAFLLQPVISSSSPEFGRVNPILLSVALVTIMAITAWHYLQEPLLNMRSLPSRR